MIFACSPSSLPPLSLPLPIPLLNWMRIVLSTAAATAIIVGFRCDKGGWARMTVDLSPSLRISAVKGGMIIHEFMAPTTLRPGC